MDILEDLNKIYKELTFCYYPSNLLNMSNLESFDLYRYKQMYDDEIQLSYKGPFDSKVLSVIGEYIQKIIGPDSPVSQKLFKIFIELAQNIGFYSGEKSSTDNETGVGMIIIREVEDQYFMHTGNLISTKDAEIIIEKCEIINSLDRQGLREFKRKQRNLPPGEKGTANVGLIQVALTSENPLKFKMSSIDKESSFFSIMVTVNKN